MLNAACYEKKDPCSGRAECVPPILQRRKEDVQARAELGQVNARLRIEVLDAEVIPAFGEALPRQLERAFVPKDTAQVTLGEM